jgi:hypothetical protein
LTDVRPLWYNQNGKAENMARSKEEKLAEKIANELNNHNLNLSLVANILVNNNPTYTQDRIMELVKSIIKHADHNFIPKWEAGETSESLMLANVLNETLNQLGK